MSLLSDPRRADVSDTNEYQSALIGSERGMPARTRIANPCAFRVFAELVAEPALQYQDFLTAGMTVRIESGAGIPSHQGRADAVVVVQRIDVQANDQSRAPVAGVGIDMDTGRIPVAELPEPNQDRAAFARERLVRRTRRT